MNYNQSVIIYFLGNTTIVPNVYTNSNESIVSELIGNAVMISYLYIMWGSPFDPDPGALVLGIVTDIKVIPKRNDPYIWGLNRDMVLCR